MTKQLAIQADHLQFSYEKTLVLDNINLRILEGEFIGIFGPNGGGKTTLLKLLAGFIKPQAGSLSILGISPKEARRHIGYVPQFARLDRQFPICVEEIVLMGCLSQSSFWGTFKPGQKERARSALEKVGLADMKDRSFGTLSGGQAQRVLIARALVGEPKVLLLDEPTASIDPQAEEEILQILDSLKGQMTILMVTHDLQTILHKVEKLLCIHRHAHEFSPSEVCEHFGLGLYHSPLIRKSFTSRSL
jgi:zinc transport system ATP-binding protein